MFLFSILTSNDWKRNKFSWSEPICCDWLSPPRARLCVFWQCDCYFRPSFFKGHKQYLARKKWVETISFVICAWRTLSVPNFHVETRQFRHFWVEIITPRLLCWYPDHFEKYKWINFFSTRQVRVETQIIGTVSRLFKTKLFIARTYLPIK